MKKSLFQSKASIVKKKINIMISAELFERVMHIERRAESVGISFPFNEHVEDSILKLVKLAEVQLDENRLHVEAPSDLEND